MYSSRINTMWIEIQDTIELLQANSEQKRALNFMIDRLAQYADDLEFENTKYQLER